MIIGRQGAYCGNVRYNIGKAYLTEHAIVGQTREYHNPIYIALKLSLMKLSQLQGQSAQPGLSVNTLSCISMEMPPKEIQDKIADIMLKLDRKIELNRQINDNLRASRAQNQTQFELCRGAAVNADISSNLPWLDRSLRGAEVRRVA